LTDANSAHTLIVGMTGSGKSVTTVGALLSLADSTSPRDLGILIINPKPEPEPDVTTLNALPHLIRPVITDLDEGLQALGSVVEEMRRRKREGWTQRLLVNVHELAMFTGESGSMVTELTASILEGGRGLGIHMLADTQKPLVSIVGSVNKANFPVTWVGRVANSDDARVAAPGWGLPAHLLPGRGSAYLVADGEARRVQSHYLHSAVLRPEVERIVKKGQARNSLALPEAPSARDELTSLANRVLAIHPLEDLISPDGKEKWGAQTKVVKAIHGPKAKNAGSYRDTAIAILEYLRQGERQWATS
jgi:DNA segregation ATPase FtsK/SpoIIIE-like protein